MMEMLLSNKDTYDFLIRRKPHNTINPVQCRPDQSLGLLKAATSHGDRLQQRRVPTHWSAAIQYDGTNRPQYLIRTAATAAIVSSAQSVHLLCFASNATPTVAAFMDRPHTQDQPQHHPTVMPLAPAALVLSSPSSRASTSSKASYRHLASRLRRGPCQCRGFPPNRIGR